MKKWMSLLAVALLAYAPVNADVLLEDFENADGGTDNQHAFGETFIADGNYDVGYWYAYNDEDDGGSSTATPDYMTDKEFEAGLGEGKDGAGLALEIQLGEGTDEYETAFYGIGCNLTIENVYSDLSALKSVDFSAKGSGTMNAKLLTKVTSSYTWGDMAQKFELESSWTDYSLAASDFEPEPWSDPDKEGITWDDVKDAVTKLHFQTNGDKMKAGDVVSFAVDNITLVGVSASDFNVDPDPDAVADAEVVADEAELGNAYPNPFNPVTTINFALPTAEKVSLKVFDAAGNLVKTLYNGNTASQTVQWNATNMNGAKVASGVYFYRLTSESRVITKKMVLLK